MDERVLVEAARRGDARAFCTLVEAHQRMLVASAWQMTHNREDAEDLAQEACVAAYQQLRTLQDTGKFRPWLFGILRNKCFRYLKQRRPEEFTMDECAELPAASPHSAFSELFELVEQLPLPYREVLIAHYLHELSYAEIATLLGSNEQAIRTRCLRAREQLRLLAKRTQQEEDALVRSAQVLLGGVTTVLASRIGEAIRPATPIAAPRPTVSPMPPPATAGPVTPSAPGLPIGWKLGLGLAVIAVLAVIAFISIHGSEKGAVQTASLLSSSAVGINNAGQVVGSMRTHGKQDRAFLWSASTGMRDLGTLPGSKGITANGINDAGQVLGESVEMTGPSTMAYHTFLWSVSTGMQDLGQLTSNGSIARMSAINKAGQLVGVSPPGNGSHAVLWSPSAGMHDLGRLGGLGQPMCFEAHAINAGGQVVGMANIYNSTAAIQHAFLWTASDGMYDLDSPDNRYSNAMGINDSGQVVGSALLHGGEHAFLWSPTAGMRDLGTLGGRFSHATCINNKGQVAGDSTTSSEQYHAFIWSPSTGMHDLGTADGSECKARGINDAGQVVGDITTKDLTHHAFFWSASTGMVSLETGKVMK